MGEKKIIPYIYAENELPQSIAAKAAAYEEAGADELFIYNFSALEQDQEEFLKAVKAVCKEVEIPVLIGCLVRRFEDVKKAFYTGAAQVVIPYARLADKSVIREASMRFGKDKILALLDAGGVGADGAPVPYAEPFEPVAAKDSEAGTVLSLLKEYGVAGVILKHVTLTGQMKERLEASELPIIIRDSLIRNDMEELLAVNRVVGVATNYYENKDIRKIKRSLKEAGFSVNTFESSQNFADFKLNSDGLIPVVVQDYRTNEVLMMAYMNEEAYRKTIETGRMTYFSRSRQKLWVKGETSGHYQ
ncbi:MAG TPA: bifunctional phosphoribosyl-AMP cyclohydrolase/phosphoribosyl-ATP pyrophosphatase, partial [Candidatus Caccomorpha excrementavium]|nr:bifunctional phosphoribosyl-AMP cyclohydrolase/phosphoribosyl-ATP pyrophosphatase [Candidatus Caccomorpha excrementavium]